MTDVAPGQIVILNGARAPARRRSAIQETFDGVWINLGIDASRSTTPPQCQPGVGLRPGEETHPAAPFVPTLYAALYDSIAAHGRLGLNVVVDVGHHDSVILCRLPAAPRRAAGARRGRPVPARGIMERRDASPPGRYATTPADGGVPEPVVRWQRAVHDPGIYDLAVDTSILSARECAATIRSHLAERRPSSAAARLAGVSLD